jgi:hypothetical protein
LVLLVLLLLLLLLLTKMQNKLEQVFSGLSNICGTTGAFPRQTRTLAYLSPLPTVSIEEGK